MKQSLMCRESLMDEYGEKKSVREKAKKKY